MFKKKTDILFILLAYILMLVHAVMPHHHHQEKPCIESSHCVSDNETHKNETSEHNHEHDGETSTEICVLNQAFVVPSGKDKLEIKNIDRSGDQNPYFDFQALTTKQSFNTLAPIPIINTDIPIIRSGYSHFLNTSLGLRAPPLV